MLLLMMIVVVVLGRISLERWLTPVNGERVLIVVNDDGAVVLYCPYYRYEYWRPWDVG